MMLLVLVVLGVLQASWALPPVKLGILVPDNYFMRRAYKGTALRTVSSAQRDLGTSDPTLQASLGFVDEGDSLGKALCGMVEEQEAGAVLVAASGGRVEGEEAVENLATQLHVPTLVWNVDGYTAPRQPASTVLYLMPTIRQQHAAMLDFMKSYGWHDYVIMSEYPAFSFPANTSVVTFSQDTVQQSLTHLEKLLAVTPYKTKVVLLFASRRAAEEVLDQASASTSLLNSNHVWILSSGAVDEVGAKNYPIGVFGVEFTEDEDPVKEVISDGISVWYSAVKEAVNSDPEVLSDGRASCENGTPAKNGHAFFRLMANSAADGFNNEGESLSVRLTLVNLRMAGQWTKMGAWSPLEGLELDLPVFFGGSAKPPSAQV